MYSQALRTATRSAFRVSAVGAPAARPISTTAARMGSTDRSHATGASAVPGKVQEKAPKGVEDALPDSARRNYCPPTMASLYRKMEPVHPTGASGAVGSANKTHAKGDGAESVLPKKVQEIVPESVERAVPNALHNTGDK
ncbi:hypothetical protein PG985_005145 [Apiospora marii]|uniref:uncharacterized protein n=1 Tax=Apiospora marii TaxID=335849 RepID=UPI00312E0186